MDNGAADEAAAAVQAVKWESANPKIAYRNYIWSVDIPVTVDIERV